MLGGWGGLVLSWVPINPELSDVEMPPLSWSGGFCRKSTWFWS